MRPLKTSTKSTDNARETAGFSLIELLIVVAIILVIAAIAIPNFLRSKIAANEASAAENVRTVTTAAVVYNSTWGNGYPPTLAAMGGVGTTSTCGSANLLDPLITNAPNLKSGYTYAYTGEQGVVAVGPGCGSPGFLGYLITATPETTFTGTRAFCSDEPGTIHYNSAGTAPGDQASCEALPAL